MKIVIFMIWREQGTSEIPWYVSLSICLSISLVNYLFTYLNSYLVGYLFIYDYLLFLLL